MRDSSAPERPRLAGPGLLISLAGLVGAMLCVLLPEAERILASPGRGREADEVALAYLRAALEARPGDVELRLRLARGQSRLGHAEEARETLAPLLAREGAPEPEARLVLFEGALARWRRAPAAETASGLSTSLEELLRGPLPPGVRAWLQRVALELGRPDLSASAAEQLAEEEPGHRVEWLREAGRQWLAADEAARAAEDWTRGAEVAAGEDEGVVLARQALAAARGLPVAPAVRLAERLRERFPGRTELLEDLVALALSQGAPAEANRWSAALVAGRPLEAGAWRRRREVALATGDLPGALEACERLVRLRPVEVGEWEWLARVAGWAGAPERALVAWRRLAMRGDAPGPVAHAVSLALGLGDTRVLAEVLSARARRATLTDEELTLLVEAWERLGEPERAEALLVSEWSRGPEWRRRLARLQEHEGRLTAALATWERLESEAPAEALQAQGELLWRMGRAREALARLHAGKARWGPEALGAWRLLAALAWSLDADGDALVAYRRVWTQVPGDALAALRLARLSVRAGLVAEREGRWGEARECYLQALAAREREVAARLGLLRVLGRLERRSELAARLVRWEAEAREEPVYFEPYARAFQVLGRREEAAAWFGRWARSRPEDGWAGFIHARALEEAGALEGARRVWGAALPRLRPEVEAALGRLPAHEAVEKVLEVVRLAERHGGAPESWAEALRQRAGGSAAVQDWALEHALARGEEGEVRSWLARMQGSGRAPPAWVLLRVGRRDGDVAVLQRLLEERGAELSLLDRISAERWLGHGARARVLLATEPRTGLSEVQLQALAVHAEELGERYGSRVRLSASVERLGELSLSRVGLEGRVEGPGESTWRARATHLLLDEAGASGPARETVFSLGTALGPERRSTDVELSLTGSGAGWRPSALVRQRVELSPGLRWGGDAAWGEPSDESARMRLSGTRHRLSGMLTLGPLVGGELTTTVDARWYRTGERARLGEGLGGGVQWERPWTVAGLEARVRLSGAMARRWWVPLPERSGQVGAGLSVGRRALGAGPSWSADAWSGWLWPERRPGYLLRIGAGLPVSPVGELKLRLSLGNALQSGVAGISASAELAWEYRFEAQRREGYP